MHYLCSLGQWKVVVALSCGLPTSNACCKHVLPASIKYEMDQQCCHGPTHTVLMLWQLIICHCVGVYSHSLCWWWSWCRVWGLRILWYNIVARQGTAAVRILHEHKHTRYIAGTYSRTRSEAWVFKERFWILWDIDATKNSYEIRHAKEGTFLGFPECITLIHKLDSPSDGD